MKKQKLLFPVVMIILAVIVTIAVIINSSQVKKTQEMNKNTEVMAGNFTISTSQSEYLIQNTDMKIKLISASVPDREVRDGLSSAVLTVTRKNEIKELNFRIGGLAGYMETKVEAFGVIFELKDISKDRVVIHYESK